MTVTPGDPTGDWVLEMHHLPGLSRTALRPEVLGCYTLLNIDSRERPQPIRQMPPRVRFRKEVAIATGVRHLDVLDERGTPFRPGPNELKLGIAVWVADSNSNQVSFELGDGLLGWVFSVQVPPRRMDTIYGRGWRYSDMPQWDGGPPIHDIVLMRVSCDA